MPGAAKIIAGRDRRVVRGEGDMIYVTGIEPTAGDHWYIYRPGRKLFRRTKQVLGYEQRFLGTARVEQFGEVSTLRIANRPARRS